MKALLLVVLTLAACGDQLKVFDGSSCDSDEQCQLGGVSGTCQSTGFCAYPDATCADGVRYSPGATGMAGVCVGGDACGTSEGAPCCGGTTCGTNLTCTSELTCACGGATQPCCGGATCDDGFSCTAGTCGGGIASMGLGVDMGCVSRVDGTVDCWGSDGRRRVRFGGAHQVTPVGRIAIAGVAKVETGATHACALKTDGTVWCWGHNESGQLGNGTTTDSAVPVPVSSVTGVTQLSVGRDHTCVVGTITTTGMFCWGRNTRQGNDTGNGIGGRLGNNSTAKFSSLPVPVDTTEMAASGQTVRAMAAGGYATCAITSDDRVWCWGSSDEGLGDAAATSESAVPVEVDLSQLTAPTPGAPQQIAVSRQHGQNAGFALRFAGGTIAAWGENSYGMTGDATTGARARPAAPVTMTALGGATFTSVVSTDEALCALTSDSKVWCWGRRQSGQLGDGTVVPDQSSNTQSTTPVQVANLPSTITSISGGHRGACAIDGDKRLWCWGNNRRGVLTRQPRIENRPDAHIYGARDVTP